MNFVITRTFGAAVAALVAANAWSTSTAAVVTHTPTTAATIAGAPVVVDVRISDLGAGNSLGAFDLDLGYDPALVSFSSVAFGPALGNPALFEALTGVSAALPGVIDFSEVSLLTPAELAAAQGSSFSLATLTFMGVGTGTAAFSILGTSILSDAFGRPLPISPLKPIPEPESVFPLGLGLAALTALRRQRRQRGSAAA
jgi:hypothetical protein